MSPQRVLHSARRSRFLWNALLAAAFIGMATPLCAEEVQLPVRSAFFESHCYDCHQGDEAEAGLDLESISNDLSQPQASMKWVRIFDRIQEGEMPPPEYNKIDEEERTAFLDSLGAAIRNHQFNEYASKGRVTSRRLTRKQVERTLHDLLGIDIPLADYLPAESRQHRYSTIADVQAMSHFQMQAHLAVVDRALDEAFRRALSEEDNYVRDFDPKQIVRKNPKRRCREPEMREGKAIVWNGGVTFYGRVPATTAPEDGWYRFSLTVSALKPPKQGGVWSTVRSGLCVSSAPLLNFVAAFEATTEAKTIEFETWLPKGHLLEIRPADATLKKGKFAGGQIGTGEGEPQDIPGIAFDRLTMERIHRESDADIREHLFADLQIDGDQLITDRPLEDLERLLTTFASKAFRRPVGLPAVKRYLEASQARIEAGDSLREALRFGYRAILCSPRFLYFKEPPGKLDDHAIATRLSYFLTGSCPDERLLELADSGQLTDRKTIAAEVDRLLDEHLERFVEDFAAEWLDLEQLRATVPDRKLHPKFDRVVGATMRDETHAYLAHLINQDLSVARLIEGDFTFLNSRLARYYGIDDVRGDELQGDELRKVSLASNSLRGGLLTHGAILKVTANGTNTSPVLRGVWLSERLLGVPIPPPPENVPAVEPDIRGATSIREQLEKHRSDAGCASCHRKIDPAGFALENFDAAGQWREFYPKPNGRPNRKKKIDPSYQLADGRSFADVREFRSLVAAQVDRLAQNVAENLLAYGTGAPIQFADRERVRSIVREAEKTNCGFRSIIEAVATSPIFLNK